MVTLDKNCFLRRLNGHSTLKAALATKDVREAPERRVADKLRRLDNILKDEQYRAAFFDTVDSRWLAQWIVNQGPAYEVQVIRDAGVLPVAPITEHVLRNGCEGLDNLLAQKREEITRGDFRKEDPLHMAIEYTRACFEKGEFPDRFSHRRMSYDEFVELPEIREGVVNLSQEHRRVCDAAAKDAVATLHFIEKQHNSRIGTYVIANARYGEQWVVEAIKERLRSQGIKVDTWHVRSFLYDHSMKDGRPSKEIPRGLQQDLDYIMTKKPNIAVVDGTKNNRWRGIWEQEEKLNLTRFPSAMWGYVNLFKTPELSQIYDIQFLAQALTDEFFVGWTKYEQKRRERNRVATLVCASHFSEGEFDDPEDLVKKDCFGFTPQGFGKYPIARGEGPFLWKVQPLIAQEVQRLLQ